MKPGGGAKTVSRCDIQQLCSAGRPASSRPCSWTVSLERPNSPTSAPSTRPPSLSAPAAACRSRCPAPGSRARAAAGSSLRRPVGVDRRRAAGEDQPLRLAPRDLLGADVMGQQLAEDAALAHAARDELRVLPAVVEDDDLVDGARDVDRRALVRELRARGRGGDYAVLAHSAPVNAGALSAAGAPLPFGLSGCAEAAAPREPMPTPWEVCSALPSVCSDGAIMSSARLNSARSL